MNIYEKNNDFSTAHSLIPLRDQRALGCPSRGEGLCRQ